MPSATISFFATIAAVAAVASSINIERVNDAPISASSSSPHVFTEAEAADACKLVPSLECLKVPGCVSGNVATIQKYWLTNPNAGVGKFVNPIQQTNVSICHTNGALRVQEDATDKHPFTAYTKCNSYVWQKSSALEMMIFPVKTPFDVPRYYYEIDMSPSGATYGAMIFNNKGNVTNCNTCKAEELACTGANTFTPIPSLKLSAEYKKDAATGKLVGWTTERSLPFSMFYELQASTGLFKFNLYRYDYPTGEGNPYELSGYSPTWNPSFHTPSRFALMVLV